MSVKYDGLTFELLGHASVRIVTDDGTVVYVDPWSNVVDGEPADGDVVFVTHDDTDHYDVEAIAAVLASDGIVAAYEAIDTSDLPFDVVSLPYEGSTTVDGITVRSIPAYNDPEGDHVDDDGSPFHDEGEVIGLLLTIDATTVFIPSDTDFLEHHEALSANVVIPPIGGHYTMNRHQAAELVRSVGASLAVPIHYDTFEAIKTDAEAFAEELESDGIRVALL